MKHATFFIMLMPGPELAAVRSQAEQFQATFAGQLEKAGVARLDRDNFVAFNHSTIELVKPFVDFKSRMRDEQASGNLKSLVWSSFFDHTVRKAEHFTQRLTQFSKGDVSIDIGETSDFWTTIMGEHAGFIAHLLDPEESDLILKAMETSNAFLRFHTAPPQRKTL